MHFPYGSPNLDRLLELLSTRVETLSIGKHSKEGSPFFDAVFRMLKQRIKEVDLSWHILIEEITPELLLAIISNSSLERLICSMDIENTFKARSILLGITDRIDAISITIQCMNRQMLYGDIQSGNWFEWILSMFEKRTSSVRISNYKAPVCTPEEVRTITEKLVARGKPFNFQVWLHEKPVPIIIPKKLCRKKIHQLSGMWVMIVSSNPAPPGGACLFI
ncbi:hypothetical protein PENTCL1PPCAC_20571 [Pristionchus entomophagus]|uniref:Uncharacterized protein n=1 Tax=Pristionchus entomophagus TaxID=358040 RepID=A0AAV5TVV0_9BILA|nr:hypothetical protein PENTCL1PPCAC_20571 [Pristionchus entomophagus]